jgi:hypothetical protein
MTGKNPEPRMPSRSAPSWRISLALLLSSLTGSAAAVPPDAVYQESGGLVVMEAERTPSSFGSGTQRWTSYQPTDANYVHGATNGAHLEFLGNSSSGGDPQAPLNYTFRIHESGYYHLHLRARARLDGAPDDKNNDCYVKVAGLDGATFGPGPNAGNDHLDDAPLSLLTKDTKMYGGSPITWGWANQLDAGGSSNKRWPVYQFNAGSTYRLTISGRSIKFNLDRIVFRKSTITDTSAKSAAMPESPLTGGGSSTPVVTRVVVVNADTDTDVMELTPGATLNLAAGANLNLRVDASPPIIGSVKFSLDGNASYHTDSAAPYSIGGDNIWDDYQPWAPSVGNHTLIVTPLAASGAAGTSVTLPFSVINQLPAGSPLADAGPDRTLVMPAEATTLTGSGTSPGGSITAYSWSQIGGPSVAFVSGRNTPTAAVEELVQGTYRFRLTVTNNLGLTGYDDITVNVTPAPGAPVVDAGADQLVVLPGSSATVTGTSTDPANSLYFHLWTQLSGPSLAVRSGETTTTMTVSGLVEGTYVFRLRAFSNSGLVGADDVVITVAGGSDGIAGFAPPVLERTTPGTVRLSFTGMAGRSYEFQRSTTLAGWSTLQTLPAGTDGRVEFTDSNPPAGNAFYRLRAAP